MPKFALPAYLYIDVPSAAHAIAAKQTLEALLSNGMVTMMLAQNGLQSEGVSVGEPVPVAPPDPTRRR